MEEAIIKTAKTAIKESIVSNLTGHNSPFNKMANDVIVQHEAEFKKLFEVEVSCLLNSEDFKSAMSEALHSRLAKILVSKLGGELEKRVNSLKADATTRAKITLAIDNIIKECL